MEKENSDGPAGAIAKAQEHRVTIYDIAKEVNKSPSTVSRALNGYKSLKCETVMKISAIADKMGYVANSYAKNLRIDGSKLPVWKDQERPVTIYDIAKELQVSPTTVSRALNNSCLVKTATKARIMKKAAEIGFITDNNARRLRMRQIDDIGLLFFAFLNMRSIVILLAEIK
jgi:DNA-binding LacI/PurR family transcriptional regulator